MHVPNIYDPWMCFDVVASARRRALDLWDSPCCSFQLHMNENVRVYEQDELRAPPS